VFAHHLQGTLVPEADPAVAKRRWRASRRPVRVRRRHRCGGADRGARPLPTKAASQVAYGGTMDGAVIFSNLCTGCHTSGAGGAPTLTAAGMGARAARARTRSTSTRSKASPARRRDAPKGGNPALTDDQVKATVDWMLANIK
jgi:cytochrome c5